MNRFRAWLHSARFLVIVAPVIGVSLAVAVGCSSEPADESAGDSNAAISNNGYGGSSGNDDGNNDWGGYGNYGGDDCGYYGNYGGYGCH